MKRFVFLFAIALLLLLLPPGANADSTAQQEIQSVQYLIGTWNCAHTVGTFSGTYTTTYTNALDNRWIKQTYDFPATSAGPPMQAEYFMGYDQPHQAWVRFGAMTTGQYFPIRMTDTGNGWSWKYASFFNRQRPETPGSDATFTRVSDSEYRVNGPTYRENGTGPVVTEHHVCKKVS
jgi:hypothetical protein